MRSAETKLQRRKVSVIHAALGKMSVKFHDHRLVVRTNRSDRELQSVLASERRNVVCRVRAYGWTWQIGIRHGLWMEDHARVQRNQLVGTSKRGLISMSAIRGFSTTSSLKRTS